LYTIGCLGWSFEPGENRQKGKIMTIKTAIRLQNDMVMVFDQKGEQLPEYQGRYQEVKGIVLQDAPFYTVFAYGLTVLGELCEVSREEW